MSLSNGAYKSRLIADRGYKKLIEARFRAQEIYDPILKLYNILDKNAKGNVIEEYKEKVHELERYMDAIVDDTKNYYEKMNENAEELDAKLSQLLDEIAKNHGEFKGYPQTTGSKTTHKKIESVDFDANGNVILTIKKYDTTITSTSVTNSDEQFDKFTAIIVHSDVIIYNY